jgi:pyruvate formate lyase activating enzyme
MLYFVYMRSIKQTGHRANPRIKEALLYEKMGEGQVRCRTCEKVCEIPPDGLGFCKTRKNITGKLYTLVYGDVSSLSANPIEKKPFFHFHPRSIALTIGTWSCNFTCPWCQNWELSRSYPKERGGRYISPPRFMNLMKEYHCHGSSVSFNEPTLFLEYALDIFDLAKRAGFYNTYVTNGNMSERALKLLAERGLDAMNIDVKGDKRTVKRYCGADADKIWRNAEQAKKLGVHIEITTLVVPGVNDDYECLRSIGKRIKSELGQDTPWHLTAYYPAYKFDAPSTPVATLERVRDIGTDEGLNYVYVGNVPGHRYENTYCPNCNTLLIERHIFDITAYHVTSRNTCPRCHEVIPIVGTYAKRRARRPNLCRERS